MVKTNFTDMVKAHFDIATYFPLVAIVSEILIIEVDQRTGMRCCYFICLIATAEA